MNRITALVAALMFCVATPAWAPYTSTIPEYCPDVCQPCPDCVCNNTRQSCADVTCPTIPECPACNCPAIPDCNLTCPDPCPVVDDDESRAGVYTMIGIGGANAWNTAEVTLGTFTIFGSGDIGWGYQCVVAGGIDRRGCQAYMLRRR